MAEDNKTDRISEGKTLHRGFSCAVKSADKESRVVRFIASTGVEDRHGDSIRLNGWRLERFKANPVVLFGHDADDLPIGKAIQIGVEGEALCVDIQFASAEANPMAENVYRLVTEGCLNAVSVGFIPVRFEIVEDRESGRRGYDILEAELLEISVVPIPAHPDALVIAKSKGLNMGAFRDFVLKSVPGGAKPAECDVCAEIASDQKRDGIPKLKAKAMLRMAQIRTAGRPA